MLRYLFPVALLALAGCISEPAHERYQRASAVTETVRVEIPVHPRQRALSWEQAELVEALAGEYRSRGEGGFVVSWPANAGNAEAAASVMEDLRGQLSAQGLDWRAIGGGAYEAEGADAAPVIVSFTAWRAVAPECDAVWQDLRQSVEHRGWTQFGCATERNMAAMIANPRDLQGARAFDDPDAVRRQTVIERWRQGEATAAQRSQSERGVLSDAIGN